MVPKEELGWFLSSSGRGLRLNREAMAKPKHGAKAAPDGNRNAPTLDRGTMAKPKHGAKAAPDGNRKAPTRDR